MDVIGAPTPGGAHQRQCAGMPWPVWRAWSVKPCRSGRAVLVRYGVAYASQGTVPELRAALLGGPRASSLQCGPAPR